ncbi:MAG: two-component system, OmpR family, phosphate regulon response regulator PhoB [Solirubrobacteraceae bacterium]
MSHTVLLVDADADDAAFLTDQLAADGDRPVIARTTQDVYDVAQTVAPDIVVLGDLGDARRQLAVLDDIRAGVRPFDPGIAVIVLSRDEGQLAILRAFDHGADDVAPRSVGYRELRARISALLRRERSRGSGDVIRVRDLDIDKRTRLVLLAGEPIGLTQREFTLLCHLAAEPERVFTKTELTEELWGYPAECSTRTLDSHACRLRQKLAIHGDRSWVLNVWGVGYALTDARDCDQGHAA